MQHPNYVTLRNALATAIQGISKLCPELQETRVLVTPADSLENG